MTFSPEPLVQILNNFTEMFLMIPSTKIAQTVLLHSKKGLAYSLDPDQTGHMYVIISVKL